MANQAQVQLLHYVSIYIYIYKFLIYIYIFGFGECNTDQTLKLDTELVGKILYLELLYAQL